MKTAIFATAALVAAAAADSVGKAIVVNKCNYDIFMRNVPAANGGYSEIAETLSPNDKYQQDWTQLSNGNGWSIKLSNDSSNFGNHIVQYEYTFQNDGTIWYDLSEVDGNPWDGNWEISASGSSCTPKQQAYRYATDDAYGMQACPQDAVITVTICSGESQNDDGAASVSSYAAVESSAAAVVESSAAAVVEISVGAASTAPQEHEQFWQVASATAAAPSTTMMTSVITAPASTADNGNIVIVTVTEVATATRWNGKHWSAASKRDVHQHAARHPHGHNH